MCVENESAPKGRKKRSLVPSKGLEPPHPCAYMDLNHARLPIPPRWQVNLHSSGDQSSPRQEDQLFYSTDTTPRVNSCLGGRVIIRQSCLAPSRRWLICHSTPDGSQT